MTVNPKTLNPRRYKSPGSASLRVLPKCVHKRAFSFSSTEHNLNNLATSPPLPIMVAINIRRAANALYAHCNRYFDKLFHVEAPILDQSSSLVHPTSSNPAPNPAPVPLKKTWSQSAPSGQIPRGRKQGRVKRKRYNEIAKENSTVFVPGRFPKRSQEKKDIPRDAGNGYEPIDCDPETAEEGQAGWTFEEPRPDHSAAGEALLEKELKSLFFEKDKREGIFKVKLISERVKAQAGERKARLKKETKEAEKLRKMQELEKREEKERAGRWKDQRLAQLEREKQAAESELAREKVERKQSRLQRVFKEQQRRRDDEELWKQLREEDAMSAAQREEKLLRENVMLLDNLRVTDDAFRRVCNERDHIRQEKEEERARRLRAEESLHRWKELMKEYFPGGQQEQDPGHQQEQPPLPPQPPSLKAQFEIYEKKWEILRSGHDIDGTKVHLICFSQIPWPVINMTPTEPSQIQPEHIKQFLTHPLREKPDASGKRRNKRTKAKDELKRWHSDKFNQIVLSKVREKDKQAASEVAGMIARVLTEMLS